MPIQACDIFLQRWKLYKNLKSSVGAKTCAEMVGDGAGDKVTIQVSLADVSLNEKNMSNYFVVYGSSDSDIPTVGI